MYTVANLQVGLWWGLVVGLLMDTLLLLVRSTHLAIEETVIQSGDRTYRILRPSGKRRHFNLRSSLGNPVLADFDRIWFGPIRLAKFP
jgi:hypothetical protein